MKGNERTNNFQSSKQRNNTHIYMSNRHIQQKRKETETRVTSEFVGEKNNT